MPPHPGRVAQQIEQARADDRRLFPPPGAMKCRDGSGAAVQGWFRGSRTACIYVITTTRRARSTRTSAQTAPGQTPCAGVCPRHDGGRNASPTRLLETPSSASLQLSSSWSSRSRVVVAAGSRTTCSFNRHSVVLGCHDRFLVVWISLESSILESMVIRSSVATLARSPLDGNGDELNTANTPVEPIVSRRDSAGVDEPRAAPSGDMHVVRRGARLGDEKDITVKGLEAFPFEAFDSAVGYGRSEHAALTTKVARGR